MAPSDFQKIKLESVDLLVSVFIIASNFDLCRVKALSKVLYNWQRSK